MDDTQDYRAKPFRTVHVQTDQIVQGFNDVQSAADDADDRNARAKRLGSNAKYVARSKAAD